MCTNRSPQPTALATADVTRLHGVLYTGSADRMTPPNLGFVVGHGLAQHVRKPAVRRVLRRLSRHAPVLGVDFRGHGRSSGRSTVGAAEVWDIAAAVDHLRGLGCRRVVTLGFSLGAAVVLRHAAVTEPEGRPDAVIAVSSPARWWVRDTRAMRRVHWLLEQPHGRWSARMLGVRLGQPWVEIPSSPIELVGDIRPTPALLVHGRQDHYFPVSDAVALRDAGGCELWIEPGMRHAEQATTPALVDRIAGWAVDTVTSANSVTAEAATRDGCLRGG